MTKTLPCKIRYVYHFANGQVLVFGDDGQQIPEYQGRYADVIAKIRAVYGGPIKTALWRCPYPDG